METYIVGEMHSATFHMKSILHHKRNSSRFGNSGTSIVQCPMDFILTVNKTTSHDSSV